MIPKTKFALPTLCAAALFGFHSSGLFGVQPAAIQQESQQQSPTKTETGTRFIRLSKEGNQLRALQTAITRYSSKEHKNVSIDLVGVVHIGEAKYYETLNELFSDYDAVLYELVAPEGREIPQPADRGNTGNPIAFLQASAQRMLGLESQLAVINYDRQNFVHADLSPQELSEKMRERGDTPWSLALGALSEILRQSSSESAAKGKPAGELTLDGLSELMTQPLKAKRLMAQQFAGPLTSELGLGKSLNQLVVDDRNAAAMKELRQQLKLGKKKIAIFYGAAHMPDFEKRLTEMSFNKTNQSWVNAWDLTASHADPSDHPMSLLMQMMEQLGK